MNYLYNGGRIARQNPVRCQNVMTYLLNLLDLALTLYALSIGCTEMNPLMQSLPIMIFYKVVAVGGLCWVLQHYRSRRGLRLCTAVYAAVCAYHLYGILLIGGI